jgi:hypothetical protein
VTPTRTPTPTPTPIPYKGCSPHFWKNHTRAWGPTGYKTFQTLESVFNVPNAYQLDYVPLLFALALPGGPGAAGGARILMKQAVAALLNAAHPSILYPLTPAQVISRVNTALASGNRATMVALAAQLESYNTAGCPLS